MPIKREYLVVHVAAKLGWRIEKKLWVQIGLNSDDVVKNEGLGASCYPRV